MPGLTKISPEVLHDRHHLSPQQINSVFSDMVISENLEEKTAALGKAAEFIRVTDNLRSSGIDFIPLKGPLLSHRIYGDATFRCFNDLDILVDSSSLSRVINIAETLGYKIAGHEWPDRENLRRRLLKYYCDIAFICPDTLVTLEIHWRLLTRQNLNYKPADKLIDKNQTSVYFSGRNFIVLNNELELLYLVIHGGKHHWGRLRWLVDVSDYIKTQKIDWDKFSVLTDQIGARRFVSLCSHLLSVYLPGRAFLPCTDNPSALMLRYSVRKIEADDFRSPETMKDLICDLRFSLSAYKGLLYKLRVLADAIGNSLYFGRLSRAV